MSFNLGLVLEVAIGMVFTYTLLAIVVSGLQEVIAGWLNMRGKALKAGIQLLLGGTPAPGAPDTSLFTKVFGHGLIEDISNRKMPAYVPSRNFALAVMEALKDGTQGPLFTQIENSVAALPNGTAREVLTSFVTHAAGDIRDLQKRIETWFDDAMDRLSGSYKRYAQIWLLVIGLTVSVVLNVDSIALVRTLSIDDKARERYVQMAETYVKSKAGGGQITPEEAKASEQLLTSLPLQFGWREMAPRGTEQKSAWELFKSRFKPASPADGWRGEGVWLVTGWLISALASTLGAPYWFALLQQLFNLRNAGPKPPDAAERQGAGK